MWWAWTVFSSLILGPSICFKVAPWEEGPEMMIREQEGRKEYSWDWSLEKGRGRSGIGQREKLGDNAVSEKS